MTTSKSVGRSNAPQETATDCGYIGLQANVSTVGLLANKYIALNYKSNITGNYAVSMHKSLKHECVHYTLIGTSLYLNNIEVVSGPGAFSPKHSKWQNACTHKCNLKVFECLFHLVVF